jgi:hypothetical protein
MEEIGKPLRFTNFFLWKNQTAASHKQKIFPKNAEVSGDP